MRIKLTIAMFLMSILLVACADKSSSETIKSSDNTTNSEVQEIKESAEVMEKDGSDPGEEKEKETSKDIKELQDEKADEEIPINDFDLNVCGKYVCYNTEAKECNIEINSIDGIYYIEYSTEEDYAAAEIELLEANVSNDHVLEFKVNMYPFSGFSFAGDYWGKGYTCGINVINRDLIVISEGQPFLGGLELALERKDFGNIHSSMNEPTPNGSVGELIGKFRTSHEENGVKVNMYLELNEDGTIRALCKNDNYPMNLYVGKYNVKSRGGKIIGDISCEKVGFGGMPYNWDLTYDENNECPVILEEGSNKSPFEENEGDELSFARTKAGETKYSLGPGIRGDELEGLYQGYLGYTSMLY